MGRGLKVPISFKQSEKKLYEFLQGKLSPSVYIKEILIREMKKEGLSLVDHKEEVEKEIIKPVQNFEF